MAFGVKAINAPMLDVLRALVFPALLYASTGPVVYNAVQLRRPHRHEMEDIQGHLIVLRLMHLLYCCNEPSARVYGHEPTVVTEFLLAIFAWSSSMRRRRTDTFRPHFLMTIKNNLLNGHVLGARQLVLVPPGVVLRHEGFGERVVQVDGGELVLAVC